jgi:hypothetical protein
MHHNPQPAHRAGFRSDGASRIRTGDLLGAIQKRDIGKLAPEAGFRPFQQCRTPRIPRACPGVLGWGELHPQNGGLRFMTPFGGRIVLPPFEPSIVGVKTSLVTGAGRTPWGTESVHVRLPTLNF